MTEKRFKISIGEFEEENISDTVKNIEITEISDMCTQMNTLYEENEQLKKEVDRLHHEIENNIDSFKKNNRERLKLKKENKELKLIIEQDEFAKEEGFK